MSHKEWTDLINTRRYIKLDGIYYRIYKDVINTCYSCRYRYGLDCLASIMELQYLGSVYKQPVALICYILHRIKPVSETDTRSLLSARLEEQLSIKIYKK